MQSEANHPAKADDDTIRMAENDENSGASDTTKNQSYDDDTVVVYGEIPKRGMDIVICKPFGRRERTGSHIGSRDRDTPKEICMTTADWEVYKQRRDLDVLILKDHVDRQLGLQATGKIP